MLVAEYLQHTLRSRLVLQQQPVQLLLLAFFFVERVVVGGLEQFLALAHVLDTFLRLEILESDAPEYVVVPSYFLLLYLLVVRYVIVYDIINVLEVFVENLVDLCWLGDSLLALQISCHQQHSVLESILDFLLIVLHQWPYLLKVSLDEAGYYGVLVFVDTISEKVLIL